MTRRLIILSVFIAMACTEPPEVIPFEFSKAFTGEEKKGWTIRSFQYLEDGKGTQTGQLGDCLKDDLYIFYANEEHLMQITNGSHKCDESDPNLIAEGSWSYTTASATLSLPFPLLADVPLPFVVREVEEDRMTLEIFFADGKSSYRFNFRSADLE